MREAREKKAATSMEGATQELERRSQYLSSLIQRTKVKSDDATPAAAVGDRQNQRNEKKDAELPSLQRVRRQERRHLELPHQRQQQKQIQQSPPPPPPPTTTTTTHQHLMRQDTKKKCVDYDEDGGDLQEELRNVRIRAADMPAALQKRAFRCAREMLAAMPKLDSKRLALALKKEFDSSYGPAWHCIVGTSFGSYVTHSLGGFLYFSIDKVYILLFRTVVEPLGS